MSKYCKNSNGVGFKFLTIGYEAFEALKFFLPNQFTTDGRDEFDIEPGDIDGGPSMGDLGDWHIFHDGIGVNDSAYGATTYNLMHEDWAMTLPDGTYMTPGGDELEYDDDPSCDEEKVICDAAAAYHLFDWSPQMGAMFPAMIPMFVNAFENSKFAWQYDQSTDGYIDNYIAAVSKAMKAIDPSAVQNGAMMFLNVIAPKDMAFDKLKLSMDEFAKAMPTQKEFTNLIKAIRMLNKADDLYLKSEKKVGADADDLIQKAMKNVLMSFALSMEVDFDNFYSPHQKKIWDAYVKNLHDLLPKIVKEATKIEDAAGLEKAMPAVKKVAHQIHLSILKELAGKAGNLFAWLRKSYTPPFATFNMNGTSSYSAAQSANPKKVTCEIKDFCGNYKRNIKKTIFDVNNKCINANEIVPKLEKVCTGTKKKKKKVYGGSKKKKSGVQKKKSANKCPGVKIDCGEYKENKGSYVAGVYGKVKKGTGSKDEAKACVKYIKTKCK